MSALATVPRGTPLRIQKLTDDQLATKVADLRASIEVYRSHDQKDPIAKDLTRKLKPLEAEVDRRVAQRRGIPEIQARVERVEGERVALLEAEGLTHGDAASAAMAEQLEPMAPERRELIVREMPLDMIEIGKNVRDDVGDVSELAASIAEVGVLQPIRIHSGPGVKYELTFGQRRLAAARLAGLTTIPAIVDGADAKIGASQDRQERSIQQLIENLQRADLNALEEAKALKALTSAGLTHDQLAKKIGRSRPYVSNVLNALEAPKSVQKALAEGTVSLAHVKAVSGLPAEDQTRLIEAAVSQGYSSKQTERDAKYARDRQRELAANAKGTAAATKAAVAALERDQIPQGTVVYAMVPWGLDKEVVKAAIEAGGWQVKGDWHRPDRPKGCDCSAVNLTVAQKGEATTAPTCDSEEHRQARQKEIDAERAVKQQQDELELGQLRVAFKAAWQKSPPDPVVARLLVATLDGYSREKWATYAGLSDAGVLEKLTQRLTASVGRYFGAAPLPMKTLLAALGAAGEPARKPRAQRARAGEDVSA